MIDKNANLVKCLDREVKFQLKWVSKHKNAQKPNQADVRANLLQTKSYKNG